MTERLMTKRWERVWPTECTTTVGWGYRCESGCVQMYSISIWPDFSIGELAIGEVSGGGRQEL